MPCSSQQVLSKEDRAAETFRRDGSARENDGSKAESRQEGNRAALSLGSERRALGEVEHRFDGLE
jgi:hypothetical protein